MIDYSTIRVSKLQQLCKAGAINLIDVRTPVEFREIHTDCARNVPLDKLSRELSSSLWNGTHAQPLYVMCNSGNRSAKACQELASAGREDVFDVEGGLQAWIDTGLPVIRGKKAVSLERQVRIVAGAIVLVGAILAMAVHPYFAGISAFVGAGLMFAGITDTCGMAMMLAKMPWNQVTDETPTCSVD